MAEYNEQELRAGLISLRRRRKLQRIIKAGGVVSLGSLWAITKPEILADIKGDKALVKSRKLSDGSCSLYIEIPLLNDKYEELDLCGMTDFEEGDEVSISSIIAIFTEDVKGKPIVRYEAFLVDENVPVRIEDVKRSIFNESVGLMLDSKTKAPTINISFEGGKCPEEHYQCFICTNCVFIKIFDSNSWRIIRLDSYKNARPLSHGLILAESLESKFNILNADGSVICKDIDLIDYGPNYLLCDSHLWWYNAKSNLWEEKNYNPYLNVFSHDMQKVSHTLKKVQFTSSFYFYIYECEFWGEKMIGKEDDCDWIPENATYVGLLDNDGSWVIKAKENVKGFEFCHSIIIVNRGNSVTLYDSKRKVKGLLKEIITIDKCEIKNGKYLLLTKDSLQGVCDAEVGSVVIPCCIDGKYTLKPNTIANGMIGVYSMVEKKRSKSTYQEKKFFYLDYQGNVVLEIEDGWVIDTCFKDGKAKISRTDNYHGHYYEQTIDIQGNVLKEDYRSFPGEIDEYQREDMRNLDRDNWDAMTDGMYGDYPEEGFDGDYESIGF